MDAAEALAQQVEQVTSDLVAAVERCPQDRWEGICAGEGGTINVVAHHAAGMGRKVGGIACAVATGAPVPALTLDGVDEANARHAQEFAQVTKREVIEEARGGSVHAARVIRGLTEEQLARTANLFGGDLHVQELVERILIGHVRGHLVHLQQAISDER